MKRAGYLGGEQSGHIIDLRFTPSGDGIAAALLLLEALDGRDLAKTMVSKAAPAVWSTCGSLTATPSSNRSAVREAIEAEAAALDGRGRVLVRPSGTEPLVRVMVEAPATAECEAVGSPTRRGRERELGPASGRRAQAREERSYRTTCVQNACTPGCADSDYFPPARRMERAARSGSFRLERTLPRPDSNETELCAG